MKLECSDEEKQLLLDHLLQPCKKYQYSKVPNSFTAAGVVTCFCLSESAHTFLLNLDIV